MQNSVSVNTADGVQLLQPGASGRRTEAGQAGLRSKRWAGAGDPSLRGGPRKALAAAGLSLCRMRSHSAYQEEAVAESKMAQRRGLAGRQKQPRRCLLNAQFS